MTENLEHLKEITGNLGHQKELTEDLATIHTKERTHGDMTTPGVKKETKELLPPTGKTPEKIPEIGTPTAPPAGQTHTQITPHKENPGPGKGATPPTGDRNIPLHPGIRVNTGIDPPPPDTELTGPEEIHILIIDLSPPAGKIPTNRK